MTTQALQTTTAHLPLCGRCADAIREKVEFLAGAIGCFCEVVPEQHYHDEPGIYLDVAGQRFYCPPCVCCSTFCVPDAVLCAEIEGIFDNVVAIKAWEFSELAPA